MLGAIRYWWGTTSGYRLKPWRSPYIRWRLETYFGKKGDVSGAGPFLRLLWQNRKELGRFVRWVEERQAEQARRPGLH